MTKSSGNQLWIDPIKCQRAPSVPPSAAVTDFREIHNADLPALKAWYATLPGNFRPMHLSVQLGSDGKRFDALALDDGTATVYEAHLGLRHATPGGPLPNLDDGDVMWPQGWQQSSMMSYMSDGVYHRHHVWTQGPPLDQSWHLPKDLELGLQRFREKRQRPIGVIEYGDNLFLLGGPDNGLKWELHHGLTEAAVREKLADARTRKWRPDLIHRHSSDLDKFALVLVENPKDDPWEYHSGLTLDDYRKRMAESRGRGHRPQSVQSWVGKGDAVVYSGLWVGDLKPLPLGLVEVSAPAVATGGAGARWVSFGLRWLADPSRRLATPTVTEKWRAVRPKSPELAPVPRERK